jgi:YVTN family beta-propeller protein
VLRPRAAACLGTALLVLGGALAGAAPPDTRRVGTQFDGSILTPDNQELRPAGRQVEFGGRPNAVAVRPDGRTAAVLADMGAPITIVDLATATVVQRFEPSLGDASFAGIAYSRDGRHLYASFTRGVVLRTDVWPDGTVSNGTPFRLPKTGRDGRDDEIPGGLAVSRDGRRLYVTLSRANALAVLDTATGRLLRRYAVGNAPHAALLAGDTVVVSNRGGRRARPGDRTNDSAGTPIVSTASNGAAATGTVSFVNLRTGRVTNVRVGLHPTGLALRGRYVFVTNSNSDTVSVLDLPKRKVVSTIAVRPFPGAPFGSSPNAVMPLGRDRLVVSLGRNNALAVYRWVAPGEPATFEGMLPTGWYPADVVVDGAHRQLVVANDKGVGAQGDASADPVGDTTSSLLGRSTTVADPVSVRTHRGSVSLIPFPDENALRSGTGTVYGNNAWAAAQASRAAPRAAAAPVAIPARVGEPSLIKHVFYVVKENRTYDQVLGDDVRGDGDPRYLQFGAAVTPNQHLIARRFPLLDNFYVSGSLSADGHQWATQAFVTDYIEKSFGDFARAYSYDGGDALAYAPTGFLWENAQRHGKTVRVYGEFADHSDASGTRSDVPSLDKVLVRRYPRYDLAVPDEDRVRILLDDVQAHLTKGSVADLTIVQLPLDHTRGLAPDQPTPESDVSDNDAALGLLVQTLSQSPIWAQTAVFVVEDDAQAGLDHVDGHRTTAYVASPYARNGVVDSTYYTQINMVRTIEQILGLPPMNQMDLAAQPMTTAFTDTPDLTPFVAVPRSVPETLNPPLPALSGVQREWAEESARMDFTRPDAVPEELLNRAVWYAVSDWRPYPGDGGTVLSPAQVMARYGTVTKAEAEAERESGADRDGGRGYGLRTLSATGLGSGVSALGLVLLAGAALAQRRRSRFASSQS